MYGVSRSKEGTSGVAAQRIETPSAGQARDDAGPTGIEAGETRAVPEPDAVR
jgi:hypothetical protein